MITNPNINAKADIIDGLIDVFDRTIEYCQNQDHTSFEKSINDKWSTAQNIEHLCSSTFPIAKAMAMPKLMMKMTFGTNNREERSITEIYDKYQVKLKEGLKAPSQFEPAFIGNNQKKETLEKFKYAKEKLIKIVDKWDEKAMSKYLLPHPALGKMTIREILLFTIFHTEHHLNAIKRIND